MKPSPDPNNPEALAPVPCSITTPQRYFWLMAQILVFYSSFFVLVCFVYRKYFQDPHLKKKEEEEEAKREKEMEALF